MLDPPFHFIRPKELRKMLGLSRSRIEAMVREGRLPPPYRLGKRAIGWRSDEVEVALNAFEQSNTKYASCNEQSK